VRRASFALALSVAALALVAAGCDDDSSVSEAVDSVRTEAEARLDDARQALGRMVPRESARSVRIEIRTGDVASGLVGAAVDLAADLIVMGGRSRLVRAVARRAPCPVLAA